MIAFAKIIGIMRWSFLCILFSLSVGCVTTYMGEKPDFQLRGVAAEKEFHKFTINESIWSHGYTNLEMGGKLYWLSSLRPVIKDVSPKADERIDATRWKRILPWVFFAGAVIVSTQRDFGQLPLFMGFIGASLSASIYASYDLGQSAKIYNQDLKSKFAPQISLKYNY